MAQRRGTVAWFNNGKGYGFLKSDGNVDVFCHFSAIKSDHGYKTLSEGDQVVFDVEVGPTGREQAANVAVSK